MLTRTFHQGPGPGQGLHSQGPGQGPGFEYKDEDKDKDLSKCGHIMWTFQKTYLGTFLPQTITADVK